MKKEILKDCLIQGIFTYCLATGDTYIFLAQRIITHCLAQ